MGSGAGHGAIKPMLGFACLNGIMRVFWDDLSRSGWTDRLDLGRSVALQQSWDYGQAARAQGAGVGRARVADGKGDIAVAQMLDRYGLRLINRGPVWLRGVDPAEKRRVLRLLARGVTVATAERPLSGFGLVPLLTGRFHSIWDLNPLPDVLREGLERRWAGRLAAASRGAPVPKSTLTTRIRITVIPREALPCPISEGCRFFVSDKWRMAARKY